MRMDHPLPTENLEWDRSAQALDLFLNAFRARDLADPLPSFDQATPAADVRAAIKAGRWDVVGVRQGGILRGWLGRDDLVVEPFVVQAFDERGVISDQAAFDVVIQGLQGAPQVFVRACGQIAGVIRARDLQKPPMRMWLFGLVTIMELRVTQLIGRACPADAWRAYLSEGRIQLALKLQAERRRRQQSPALLDCLQFADKGRIVARHEELLALTRFPGRRAVEEFVRGLQDLRNNLAHSQDLAGDWTTIVELATHLRHVVLGPQHAEPE